jgi:hypothetical protein
MVLPRSNFTLATRLVLVALLSGIAGAQLIPDLPSIVPPGVEGPLAESPLDNVDAPAWRGFDRGEQLDHLTNVPRIAAWSETQGSNDTLVATGVHLEGVSLVAFWGDRWIELETLAGAADRIAAVIPADAGPACTAAIWPVGPQGAGEPIRINGATLWWAWPARIASGSTQRLRLFGKHLMWPGQEASVVLAGADGIPIDGARIAHIELFEAEVELPPLAEGTYRIWLHNGSGARWGWSSELSFDVVAPTPMPVGRVRVESPAGAGQLDDETIDRAIAQLIATGGGTLEFGAGVYQLGQGIVLPVEPVVHLRGQGRPALGGSAQANAATTLIRFSSAAGGYAVRSEAPAARVESLGMISEGGGRGGCLDLAGPNQVARNLLLIRLGESRQAGVVRCSFRGAADQQILDCELHAYESAVRIERGTHRVRIADCTMRGWYDRGNGVDSNAVINLGGDHMILERCDFASVDRAGGRIFCRSFLGLASDLSRCVVADNVSHDIGPQPNVPDIIMNTPEQILFHARREEIPPFRVTAADGASLHVNADRSLRRVQPGWIAFIARGRGAGQWREIRNANKEGRLELVEPWRVDPEPGAIVVLLRSMRHNLVVRNTVLGQLPQFMEGRSRPVHWPTLSIALWHASFDNVVAFNHADNAAGIYLTTRPTQPSAWNLVMDNMWADQVPRRMLNFNVYPPRMLHDIDVDYWHGAGNVFRRNTGQARDTIAAIRAGWDRPELRSREGWRIDEDTGPALTVFEHNTMEGVRQAGTIVPPTPWLVWRNNPARRPGGAPVSVRVFHPARIIGPPVDEIDSRYDNADTDDPSAPDVPDDD